MNTEVIPKEANITHYNLLKEQSFVPSGSDQVAFN